VARSVMRSSLILFVGLLCVGLLRYQSQELQGAQNTRSLELSGRWLTEDGRQVVVEHSDNHVHATFTPEDDQCANGATLEYLLDADLSGVQQVTESDYPKTQASISGKIAGCTDLKVLEQCPNLAKIWETTFDGTAAPSVISGDAFIEGIDSGCNVNHQYDSHSPFTLTACEDINIMPGDPSVLPDANTKLHVRVTCKGTPVDGVKVDMQIEPQDSSGGHIHVDKRPKGRLNGKDLTEDNPNLTLSTDSNGEVNGSKGVTFAPPVKKPKTRCVGVAGDYKITAKSHRTPDHMDHTMLHVGFQNLTRLSAGQNYDICANSTYGCTSIGPWGTDTHPDTDFGTANTLSAFQSVAADFYTAQQTHNQQLHACNGVHDWPIYKVSFNDIALPNGGLLDISASWDQPHQTHGKGEGGDFNHFYANATRKDCKNGQVVMQDVDTWLWSILKKAGENHGGAWDASDLAHDPPLWHLHIDDAGATAPSECPADD